MNPADVYRIFFKEEDHEVVEIRAYGLKKSNPAWEGWAGGAGIVYGYFDNPEDFGRAAEALEKAKAPGIYFTLNPVNPDLLARAANRLKAADMKTSTTSDKDIRCIRWLPIDLDPIRPAGISSTATELKKALSLRNKIWKYMKAEGWEECVPACSGNGAHLAYQLPDLENTPENVQLIRECLAGLAAKFSTAAVEVDEKVYNPARIWKLYGTTARKGDHTKSRPHRKSYIEPKWLAKNAQKDKPGDLQDADPDRNPAADGAQK